jgi:glycosyltransferase involved in cell wall biosynthesis
LQRSPKKADEYLCGDWFMKIQPRLSIGVPIYNGEAFLDGLLRNLQAQTFQDFEIILSDNASTDRTREICLDHSSSDARIRYSRNDRNLGANPNYNKVFSLSEAELFKWAAHDDLYGETFLELCVRHLDENPDAVLAHCDCLCIDDLGRPFARGPSRTSFIDPRSGLVFDNDPVQLASGHSAIQRFVDVLFKMNCNMPIFGVIRRAALKRTRLMRNFYGTDKLLLAELALLGRFVQSPQQLYHKRFHNSMSWVLTAKERRDWSLNAATRYPLRMQQLAAFTAAPFGKGLSMAEIAACLVMVSLLGPKVMIQRLRGFERRRQLRVRPWRTT